MRKLSALIILILCFSHPAYAAVDEALFNGMRESILQLQKTVESLQATVESQNSMLQMQGAKLAALEKAGISGDQSALSTVGSSSQGPLKVAGLQGFNPEIGITGTVQTKLTENSTDGEGNDTIALKELELNFAQVVDPYSRLDAILSFNDALEEQNAEIEEAYYTRWGLPLGFTGQIGKFRSKIGKQNLLHAHQLPTADYALVLRDFFGEEGLASSGVRLQNNIPNPWDIPVEITGEVLRGNNGPSFSGISRRPIFNTHLKTFFETTENSNLELGWTTLFGDENPPVFVETVEDTGNPVTLSQTRSKGSGRYGVKIFGADATWNWFLPEGKKVSWQNEIYFQKRGNLVHINDDPWGFYSLIDYKFSPKFSAGIRFDYLEPLDVTKQHLYSTGVSPYLIFWQSEFADFKLQFSHLEPANADAKTDNQIFLQVDFLIGAHKHPVQ